MCVCVYAVLTSVSFLAQETKNARIIQELNYSNIFYYIIQVDNTNTFYKTTASDIRKFKVNDIVKLKDVNRPDNYLEVLYTNLEGMTLAERLISNQNTRLSNDVLFSLPTIHDGILFFDNEIHKSGNKSRNSRRCKKTRSKIFARYGKYTAGNGEITSSHTLNKDGIVISNTMEIIACP